MSVREPPGLDHRPPSWPRLAVGGCVSGLLINLRLVIGARYYEGGWGGLLWALRRLHVAELAAFVLPGFVAAGCLLWIYRLTAVRFGSGAKSAARAALVVWLLCDLPLFVQMITPYRLRPVAMAAIDFTVTLAAALFAAFWLRP